MYLTQIIPDPNKLMDASNSLIVDQGIAIFAVVVFAIVIFGMMGQMFMMLRQSGRMLTQMGKESTQNDLDRAAALRNTDELIDVKQLLARLIDMQTEGNNNKTTAIQTGIKNIKDNTESVDTMNGKLEDLEKAVTAMIETINTRDLEIAAKVETLSANMITVLERLDELTKEAEAPTEEIHITQPHTGTEPPLGKVTVVGKPSIGDVETKSATYPTDTTKTEKDGT